MSSPAEAAAPWWRDAVVYRIYPRSFQDTTGDGVGDLRGITRRLDHVERLGADAIWLSPIYPSPFADMGYDVSDFTAVDPRLGSMADLDELLGAAHRRGIRVLLDLVLSHTSIEHPWFRKHPAALCLVKGRRSREQLALDVRRTGLEPRPRVGRLVSAQLLSRTARPRLAQS